AGGPETSGHARPARAGGEGALRRRAGESRLHLRRPARAQHPVDPVRLVGRERPRNRRPRGAQGCRHRAGDVRIQPPRRSARESELSRHMGEILLIYTAFALAKGSTTFPIDADGFMPFQDNYHLWKLIGFAGIGTFGRSFLVQWL